jgi:pSer/pThr/pTyr-binding forkhead associated (FHA) protein
MIQLNLLSGKMAGAFWVARRFPVRIGRSARSDLQLEEEGVWEQHLQIEFKPREGFILRTLPNALAAVNGQPIQETLLRNGDTVEVGSVKLRFWLGESRQAGLQYREWLTWLGIGAVCLAQIGIIYWLRA